MCDFAERNETTLILRRDAAARDTPKFINFIATLNLIFFPTRGVCNIKKGGWQNHGLSFEMLKGPTQSAFCSAKNWLFGKAKTLHVLICYSTDTFVICRMWEHKHYATFVLEKVLKKNSSVSTQTVCSRTLIHPRWFGLLLKFSRFYRCNNRCKSKMETTNPDVYTLYSDKKVILK